MFISSNEKQWANILVARVTLSIFQLLMSMLLRLVHQPNIPCIFFTDEVLRFSVPLTVVIPVMRQNMLRVLVGRY